VNDAAAAPVSSRRKTARAVGLLALAAFAVVCARAAGERWAPARASTAARDSGWVAFATLLLSLSVTPLARIAARLHAAVPAAPVVRRALGMASAWLALLHAFITLQGTLAWNFSAVWNWPHLRAGLGALAILLVLLLTSFARVIALLRLRFFRELHRLSYAAPLLVLQHVALSPFGPRALALGLVLLACVLGLGRCL
jgi:DMSO/TMAO reductase YedYZ heme-binding membrane subunit